VTTELVINMVNARAEENEIEMSQPLISEIMERQPASKAGSDENQGVSPVEIQKESPVKNPGEHKEENLVEIQEESPANIPEESQEEVQEEIEEEVPETRDETLGGEIQTRWGRVIKNQPGT
jgi:hypothetical protein